MVARLLTASVLVIAIAACSSDIYLYDGVTDGDTFYLAQHALSDADPALQSWVSYSLGKSACQLRIGGENPARASSFECELTARRLLLESWNEKVLRNPDTHDQYLDDLASIHDAGYLPEYVARYFTKADWTMPEHVRNREFRQWQRRHLPGHRPQTIFTGSWNYRERVTNY